MKPSSKRGFSIVEMLVAMAVLALLTVLLARVVGMSTTAVSGSTRAAGNNGQMRFAMDRLAIDFSQRLKRTDLPFEFKKSSGNDEISFYSEVDSYSGDRRAGLVTYRVQATPGDRFFQLERGVGGTSWEGASQLPFGSSTLPAVGAADYDVLADGILRLEVCFVTREGKLVTSPGTDLDNLQSIVVTTAAVEAKTRKLLTDGQLQALAESLPDAQDDKTPLAEWEKLRNSSGFGTGIPLPAVQSIRFSQRAFPLH